MENYEFTRRKIAHERQLRTQLWRSRSLFLLSCIAAGALAAVPVSLLLGVNPSWDSALVGAVGGGMLCAAVLYMADEVG